MKLTESTISYNIYEENTKFLGTSEVTLPDLTALTQQISGSGIAGNVEAVLTGQYEAMSLGMNFRVATELTPILAEPRRHHIDIVAANQVEDTVTGSTGVQSIKHVMVIKPKKVAGGKLAPASPSDTTYDFAVYYWATYVDGRKVQEIDPMNNICIINGVDYLAPIRRALGE